MLLKNALELSQSIVYLRKTLYDYKKQKNFSHQDLIKLSQELDKNINLYQKMIEEVRSAN